MSQEVYGRRWPMGPKTGSRNKAKLQNPLTDENYRPLARNFHLANNRDTARRYWSKYDHIYPHFRIEHEIGHEQFSKPSMMLILRGNFNEVVEITTTFTFTPRGEQQSDSYIHVICIVREIVVSTEEGNDSEFTKQLKTLMVPLDLPGEYFEEMTKVEKKTGLTPAWQLPDLFAKLKVKDKNVTV